MIFFAIIKKWEKSELGVKIGMGGWIVSKQIFNDSKIVYSLGIGDEWSFDLESAENGKTVYMYDGTINHNKMPHKNMIYKNECVWGNLSDVLKEEHKKENNILLKMDIEGNEYKIILETDLVKNFSQILVEVHGLTDALRGWSWPKTLEHEIIGNVVLQNNFFNKLNKDYTLIHIHQNNRSVKIGNFYSCSELTYVRNDQFEDKRVRIEDFPEMGLDVPDGGGVDIKFNWWS